MTDRYTFLLASDVVHRDGLGLELYDSGVLVAEIFRDDESGETTFTSLSPAGIPFAVLEDYVRRARESLA